MSSMQGIAATALYVGFEPVHPMKAKEALILPRISAPESRFPSPEFYSREPKGLEVSGAVLRAKNDQGAAATIFVPTYESNIHALFLVNSSTVTTTDRIVQQLPHMYVANFNKDTTGDLHTLPGLGAHVTKSLEDTLDITETSQQNSSIAFAHIVPKNGATSHAIVALQEGTRAIATYYDETHTSGNTTVLTPETLGSANRYGLHVGEFLLPTGAKLVLTTDLAAYQTQHGLEELALFYEFSEQIRTALQTGRNEDIFSALPPETLEHLMFSLSPLSVDKKFQGLVQKGNDMGSAAALAAHGLARLAKDAEGNYNIPERIAFIGSRVPRKETSKRRAAA